MNVWKTKDETLRPLSTQRQQDVVAQAQNVYEEAFFAATPAEVDGLGWWWGNKTRRRSTIARLAAQEYLERSLPEKHKQWGWLKMYMDHLSLYESDEPTPHCSKHVAVDGM